MGLAFKTYPKFFPASIFGLQYIMNWAAYQEKALEKAMDTNEISLILLGLFLMAAGFPGSANGVGAETLNLRITTVVTKIEMLPAGNAEG